MSHSNNFEEFFLLPNFCFQTIGIEIYDQIKSRRLKYIENFIYYFMLINVNIVVFGELIYIKHCFQDGNLVAGTMGLSYVGFTFISVFKVMYLRLKKPKFNQLMNELHIIFPHNRSGEQRYQVLRYLRQYKSMIYGFSIAYLIITWIYNLYEIVKYLVFERLLHLIEVGPRLPYTMWLPWTWQHHWSYYVLYFSQVLSGQSAGAGQLGNDILLCAIVAQMIMHYDHISRCVEQYAAMEKAQNDENLNFIAALVEYHEQILRLSDIVNELFGVPLLLNFTISSLVICFIGFQMTVGVTIDAFIKLGLFFLACVGQIYIICYYGQELQDASENISAAVYNHNWHRSDSTYQKILIMLIARSQKPALLRATQFISVSRGTMTMFMQTSYKFFALLRTMYTF